MYRVLLDPYAIRLASPKLFYSPSVAMPFSRLKHLHIIVAKVNDRDLFNDKCFFEGNNALFKYFFCCDIC